MEEETFLFLIFILLNLPYFESLRIFEVLCKKDEFELQSSTSETSLMFQFLISMHQNLAYIHSLGNIWIRTQILGLFGI